MIKINIIGRGNVATHLMKAFGDKAEPIAVNPHTLEGLDETAPVSLICVSDRAIADVAMALRDKGYVGLVAHTSGSTPLETIGVLFPKSGVFYPLQTFTKDKELDYESIPFFIEGCDAEAEGFLIELARMISPNVNKADSHQRQTLHIASVFACNFVNHLWNISARILEKDGMNFSLLLSLLRETLGKVHYLDPALAQTGPASRGDRNIMDAHIRTLAGSPDLELLYRMLSESIVKMSSNI